MPKSKNADDGSFLEDDEAPITEYLPWFRFYTSFVDDTQVQWLDGETLKIYVNALCYCWRNNGVLPKLDKLAWLLRLKDGTGLESVIETLIQRGLLAKTDGEIRIPPKTLNQIYSPSDSSTERVRKHRKRIKEAAEEEKLRESERNVTGNVSETFKSREEESREEKNRQKRVSDHFNEFWRLYPKKQNRSMALEEYRKAIEGHEELVPVILAGIASQRDQLAERDERYRLDASNWLKGRRWEDEPAETTKWEEEFPKL